MAEQSGDSGAVCTVLALRSALTVQFSDYPDYIRLGIGGPGTIRGYERSDFRSAHRWVPRWPWGPDRPRRNSSRTRKTRKTP